MGNTYCCKHNPIVKQIYLSMLAPTILMNLTTAIGSMADTVIIGHYLDDTALSVVTFATPIYMIINMFAALFAVGGCIAMSIDSGKGSKDTANKAFSVSMELLAVIGILLVLSGVFCIDSITGWLGAEADVFDMVRTYSRIVLISGPVFVFNVGFAFFVRNDGRPTLSMAGMFLSIIVDIVLNVVFVGVLGWGVAGAAYSTVIGQLASVLVIGSHFFSSKCTLKFQFHFDQMVFRIIQNGASTALHFIYQFLTILIINHFLAKLAGTSGVVIYTVVFNLSSVSLSLFEGISQTIQPMISNYYGEKSYKNIRETMRLAVITIFIICGLVTLLLEITPQVVPIVFGIDDILLIQKSAMAVRIYAVSMIIMTINVVIGYYLQSTEQNVMAAVMISLRCFIIFLCAILILGKMFGMNGIWAAYTVAEVLTFIICIFMIRAKQSKLKENGICVNMLLLEEDIEKQIACYTYNGKKDDWTAFENEISGCMNDHPKLREYLTCLKKQGYIEIEINDKEEKVIIRDNTDHAAIQEQIQEIISCENKWEYGPVLGWNRLFME